MERINDVLIQNILERLPENALAAAEGTCKHWAHLISERQLWRHQAAAGSEGTHGTPAPYAAGVDWRRICLHRAAASKWRSGKLLLSSTLQGHTGPITCIAVLQHIIASGSSDSTARLWDLQQGRQLHVLQHAEPVTAVALPSISLCVTATARAAHLWRQGKALRRFVVLPGGGINCLGLTDTRLLLGSTGGTVQSFDLYSGSQQLITRHGSSVTCLLAHQVAARQQQQQQEDWLMVIGTADGQVSCLATSTGQTLWQLPTKYPSRVVAMHIQVYERLQPHKQQSPQQNPQQQQPCLRQQEQPVPLLYVLNARSQLVCWRLPHSSSGDTSTTNHSRTSTGISNASCCQPNLVQLPTCSHCIGSLFTAAPTALGHTPLEAGLQGSGQESLSSAQSTAAVAAPRQAAGAVGKRHGTICSSRSSAGCCLAVCELPVPPARSLAASLQPRLVVGCTCLACPAYGSSCVLVGSSDGFLSVAELRHIQESHTCTSGASSSGEAGAAAMMVTTQPLGMPFPQEQQQPWEDRQLQQAVAVGLPGGRAGVAACSSTDAPAAEGHCAVQLARRCSLAKLMKLVPGRSTAKAAAKGGTADRHATAGLGGSMGIRGSSCSAAPVRSGDSSISTRGFKQVKQRTANDSASNLFNTVAGNQAGSSSSGTVLDGAAVRCAAFTHCGQLVVGIAAGHVCVLRFAASN